MNYRDLYEIVDAHIAAQAGTPKPVTFEFLRDLVTRDKDLVEQLVD